MDEPYPYLAIRFPEIEFTDRAYRAETLNAFGTRLWITLVPIDIHDGALALKSVRLRNLLKAAKKQSWFFSVARHTGAAERSPLQLLAC